MMFICVYHLKIQPSEFENLYFYEIDLLLNEYKEYLEERKKQNDESEKEYLSKIPNYNLDMNNIKSQFSNNSLTRGFK